MNLFQIVYNAKKTRNTSQGLTANNAPQGCSLTWLTRCAISVIVIFMVVNNVSIPFLIKYMKLSVSNANTINFYKIINVAIAAIILLSV